QCSILIDQFYRFFWRTEEDVLQNTKKTIMSFKEEMFLASWEKLEKTNTDLNLMDLIIKKQDMVKNPHFTILISPNITKNSNLNLKDTLNQILTNIHNFTFPSFEVFIGENLVANLSNSFKSQEYVKIIKSEDEYEFKKNSLDVMKGKFVYYIDKNVLNPLTLLKIAFDNLNNKHPDFIEFNIKPYRDNDFNEIKNDNIYEFSKLQYLKSFNNDHYSYFSNKVFKADFIKKNEAIFLKNNEIAVNELYEVGNSIKNKKVSILTTDEYLKSPLISVIIDNMEIYEIELNRLFESIYKQNFKSFNVILNENLEKKLNDEFREKSNLIILKDDNFKEIAIKTSKAKYALFVNIPLNYNNNSLFKGLLNRMIDLNEDENVGFLSFPLMKLRISKGTKLIKSYYSQNFIYNDLWNSKYRSKFIKFDLHLSNKLFNLNTLKIKNIYFKSPDKDVLYLYKNFKNFKEYRMSILSYLSEINLFKSMIYEHFIILKFLLMKIYIFLFKYLYLISLFIKRKLKKY
ncbi:MAG: hypothetical protein LBM96_04585, partial [Methanobrevibacter sp.]|nr:hypothetical protein [Candidatus Methanoflexus mossambicus]